MAKQSGHTRAIGTVDELNLYFDQEWGFLARMLPGVDSKRFRKDPAFAGSRRSAETLRVSNIMSSIIYRFIPTINRNRHPSPLSSTIAITSLKAAVPGDGVS